MRTDRLCDAMVFPVNVYGANARGWSPKGGGKETDGAVETRGVKSDGTMTCEAGRLRRFK